MPLLRSAWLTGTLLAGWMLPASAVPVALGPFEGQFDSRLRLDTVWGSMPGGAGGMLSSRLEGRHALEWRQSAQGLFAEGVYWHEFDPVADVPSRPAAEAASGVRLGEAFVYRHYQLGEQPGQLRLGRQVVRWGEALFMDGGIDADGPQDRSRLPEPGQAMRDTLLPVEQLYVAQSLSMRLSLEAFAGLGWRPDRLARCGSPFAVADRGAPGCPAAGYTTEAADSGGQGGLALRWLGESVELGLFASERHAGHARLERQADTRIVGVYPEHIRLYGASFVSRFDTGLRWAGELSWRPATPVQWRPLDESLEPGYRRQSLTWLLSSMQQDIERWLGAERISLAGEVAYAWTDLPARHSSFGSAVDAEDGSTSRAWGYRIRGSGEYRRLLPRVLLRPTVAFAHDVRGRAPNGALDEGARATLLALEAEYLDTYRMRLAWTGYRGGPWRDLETLRLTLEVGF